jgi:hypothetical protein
MSNNEDRKIDALDDYITRRQHGETDGGDALLDRMFNLADAIQSQRQRQSDPYGSATAPQWDHENMGGAANRKNGRPQPSKPRRVQFQPGTRTKWVAGVVPFAAVVALLLAFANMMGGTRSAAPVALHTPTLPAAETFSGAEFGDPPVATLDRYRIESSTLRAGDTLGVSAWWHTRDREALDGTIVFVHLIDSDGLLIANTDRPLGGAKETYQLTIPPDRKSGSYMLEIGVYDADSMVRLPVVADGQTDGDALILGTITVLGGNSGVASATPPYTPTPGDNPAATAPPPATITPTALPTEVEAGPVCYIALDPTIPPGRFVVTTPDPTDMNIVAEIDDGEWVPATGQYAYDQNGNLWLQVEVDGVTGWVMRWYFLFDGRGTDGCATLEAAPAALTPSMPTPMATPDVTTDSPDFPTPIPLPAVSETFDHTLAAEVGTSASYQHSIGNGQDESLQYLNIHVEGIPEGTERILRIGLECEGARQDLRWDIRGEYNLQFGWYCGGSLDFYVESVNPHVPLALYLGAGKAGAYTLHVEVVRE